MANAFGTSVLVTVASGVYLVRRAVRTCLCAFIMFNSSVAQRMHVLNWSDSGWRASLLTWSRYIDEESMYHPFGGHGIIYRMASCFQEGVISAVVEDDVFMLVDKWWRCKAD